MNRRDDHTAHSDPHHQPRQAAPRVDDGPLTAPQKHTRAEGPDHERDQQHQHRSLAGLAMVSLPVDRAQKDRVEQGREGQPDQRRADSPARQGQGRHGLGDSLEVGEQGFEEGPVVSMRQAGHDHERRVVPRGREHADIDEVVDLPLGPDHAGPRGGHGLSAELGGLFTHELDDQAREQVEGLLSIGELGDRDRFGALEHGDGLGELVVVRGRHDLHQAQAQDLVPAARAALGLGRGAPALRPSGGRADLRRGLYRRAVDQREDQQTEGGEHP